MAREDFTEDIERKLIQNYLPRSNYTVEGTGNGGYKVYDWARNTHLGSLSFREIGDVQVVNSEVALSPENLYATMDALRLARSLRAAGIHSTAKPSIDEVLSSINIASLDSADKKNLSRLVEDFRKPSKDIQ